MQMKNNVINSFFNKYIWAFLLVFIIIFSSVFTVLLFVGSGSILDYIEENANKIETRDLDFGFDETDGYPYLVNNDDEQKIKILQLTDIHLCASFGTIKKDRMVVDAIINCVSAIKPDLIVITGDFIYPSLMRMVYNTYNSSRAIGNLFETFEIPWAFVYGNHDAEKFSSLTKTELSTYYESLNYCLFLRGDENVSGEGNYIIKIFSQERELKSALFLLDSHSYTKIFHYDKIRDDQVDWYKKEVVKLLDNNNEIVPTHMFFHIPIIEYKIAWELYENNSDQVVYYFGNKDKKRIAHQEKGKIFEAIEQMQSTKTIFVGHDHTHNFSLQYKGVRLTYGLSMDYTAYLGISKQTKYRGGTLLEIDTTNGNFGIYESPQDNDYLPIYN